MEKITTPKQALERAKWLCAKQERCQSEIYKKLKEWGIEEENSEEIITQLIIENFIDEKLKFVNYPQVFNYYRFII
jgi:regulatory protein